jgi:hypothetical protein
VPSSVTPGGPVARTAPETKRGLLAAMGQPANDEAQAAAALEPAGVSTRFVQNRTLCGIC